MAFEISKKTEPEYYDFSSFSNFLGANFNDLPNQLQLKSNESVDRPSKLNNYGSNSNKIVEPFDFTFDGGSIAMNDDINDKNLGKSYNKMNTSDVQDPNGYGYVASLEEERNLDAKSIQEQQNNLFVIGAITGVSLIVIGLIITSANNQSPPSSS